MTGNVNERMLGPLVDELAEAVIIADREGTIVDWNGTAELVFDWELRDGNQATAAAGETGLRNG